MLLLSPAVRPSSPPGVPPRRDPDGRGAEVRAAAPAPAVFQGCAFEGSSIAGDCRKMNLGQSMHRSCLLQDKSLPFRPQHTDLVGVLLSCKDVRRTGLPNLPKHQPTARPK